jgi:RNA polymerase sigma factor (sigma-70 family)
MDNHHRPELPARLARDLDGSFEELVVVHQRLVFGLALRVVGDRGDAEEVAQDTFERAYHALAGYDTERVAAMRLRPWLARIALNLARNRLRRRPPAARALEDGDGQPLAVAAPAAAEPAAVAERHEATERWAELLATLPAAGGRRWCCATSRASPTPRWPRSWAGRWARSRPTCTGGCGSSGSSCRNERSGHHDEPHPRRPDGGWRELAEGLHGLRADPPATLRPAVLERVGLADAYVTVDGPAGAAAGRLQRPRHLGHRPRQPTRPASPSGSPPGSGGPCGRPTGPGPAGRPGRAAAGAGPARDPPRYDLRGTSAFEQAVLAKAQEIPRGQVRPYAWVAGELGQPAAVRAVGAALGRNPVPVLIPATGWWAATAASPATPGASATSGPCSPPRAPTPTRLERLARRGTRFFGSDTTRIYCYPTCAHARRVTGAHLQRFRGAAEAAAAGYRPCLVCRPPALAG